MRKNGHSKLITYFLLLLVLATSAFEVEAQNKRNLDKARKLTKQGEQLYNKKDYRNAIPKFSEAIAVAPTFAPAFYWKGFSHYHLNEYQQAISDFDAAISNGYEKPLEIYRVRWYLYYQAKNYDAALNDALQASRLDPNNAFYDLALGDIYFQKKSYRESVTYYKRGAQRDTTNPDVFYFIAVCHFNLNEPVEQGLAAIEALRRNTKYPAESNYFVADSLYKSRKYDEAIEYYEKTISLKPEIYGSYGALSDIYRSKNLFDKAIEIARQGLQYYPQDSVLYTSLSWYYSLADRHEEAIQMAQTAIKIAPDQYMGHTNLCRAYNDTKQYQLAIQSCNNALRINPGDGETHLYLGRAYEFLRQNGLAVENYKKAVDGLVKFTQANPDYSDGYYLLGNAYFVLQRDSEAIVAYQKCLQLAPRFARARYTLGITYLENKKKDLARDQYNILRGIDAAWAEKLRQEIEK